MQLFLNTTSPFARLARVVALEKGLAERLQLRMCDPWADDAALLAVHPQGRIPVLVSDEGWAIAESLLIAQYLDAQGTCPSLLPPRRSAEVLARTSIAYGLMEAAFGTAIHRRHGGCDSAPLQQRRNAALARALSRLEEAAPAVLSAQGDATLDQLTLAVALSYLTLRLPELLDASRLPPLPHLQAWLEQAQQRPSIAATACA